MDPKDPFFTDLIVGMWSLSLSVHSLFDFGLLGCCLLFLFMSLFIRVYYFLWWAGSVSSHIERQHNALSWPSVIVVGGGISGVAAARVLHDASFKVRSLTCVDMASGFVFVLQWKNCFWPIFKFLCSLVFRWHCSNHAIDLVAGFIPITRLVVQ